MGQTPHELHAMLNVLKHWGEPQGIVAVYEAGPTGYGVQRALCARGYRCEVVAPSLIPRRAGDRIKTDRRDALRLAELSRAGELTAIWVPEPRDEAVRDVCRAREDAVGTRLNARQQLLAFLLRHAVTFHAMAPGIFRLMAPAEREDLGSNVDQDCKFFSPLASAGERDSGKGLGSR